MGVVDDIIEDFLIELHAVQICDQIIKPSIHQIIKDYQHALDSDFYDEDEQDQIQMTKDLVKFWTDILNRIEKGG